MDIKLLKKLLLTVSIIFIHNAKTNENQYFIQPISLTNEDPQDALLKSFCAPIKFTRAGMRCFLKHTFSHPHYAKEFLAYNTSHLIEFLQFGKENKQNNVYIQSAFRLFYNKVKSTPFMTNDAIVQVLEALPHVIEYRINAPFDNSMFSQAKNTVKQFLYKTFLEKFSYFKKDPENFFLDLSTDLLQELHQSSFTKHYIEQEQLHHTIFVCLELMLNKITWTPLDQEQVWISFKNTALHIEKLVELHIINQDELDDLFQSLIERFIYFLDIAGVDLTKDTIDMIKKDLEENTLLCLTLEEQEEFITSKAERIQRAIARLEPRIMAQQSLLLKNNIR